jgi:hypothetical protein
MPCLRRAVSCAEGSSSPRDANRTFVAGTPSPKLYATNILRAPTPLRALRYPAKPRPAKPTTNIAHVGSSGAGIAAPGMTDTVVAAAG